MKQLVVVVALLAALAGIAACGTPNPDGSTTVVPQTDKIR